MREEAMNMLLTVLGFQSPYPGPAGATPGYLIQTAYTNLLLDCGSGVLAQLTRHLLGLRSGCAHPFPLSP